jgi:hypothetical protein
VQVALAKTDRRDGYAVRLPASLLLFTAPVAHAAQQQGARQKSPLKAG